MVRYLAFLVVFVFPSFGEDTIFDWGSTYKAQYLSSGSWKFLEDAPPPGSQEERFLKNLVLVVGQPTTRTLLVSRESWSQFLSELYPDRNAIVSLWTFMQAHDGLWGFEPLRFSGDLRDQDLFRMFIAKDPELFYKYRRFFQDPLPFDTILSFSPTHLKEDLAWFYFIIDSFSFNLNKVPISPTDKNHLDTFGYQINLLSVVTRNLSGSLQESRGPVVARLLKKGIAQVYSLEDPIKQPWIKICAEDNVRMRSAPGTSGPFQKFLSKGDKVIILRGTYWWGLDLLSGGSTDDPRGDFPWVQVKAPDGTVGWVYGQFLQKYYGN